MSTGTKAANATPYQAHISVRVSEDSYGGDAQFIVLADGVQVGGVQTATTSHAAGLWQDIEVDGTLAAPPSNVSVQFLNDLYGGSPSADRNLYVQSLTLNGTTYPASGAVNTAVRKPVADSAALQINGTLTFATTAAPLPTITVRVAEDAYAGDAQFVVLADGVQVGGVQTATASHAAGAWQDITVSGPLAATPATISVKFINDRYDGTPATDRNLYVQSLVFNGATYGLGSATDNAGSITANAAALLSNGQVTFALGTPTPPAPPPAPAPNTTITVRVAEDAYQGDAQFVVLADGKQVGGVQTATASHAAGAWQDVTVSGTLAAAPSAVEVEFINDAWGGTAATDRNLYVESLTVNGTSDSALNATNTARGSVVGDAQSLKTDGGLTFNLPPPTPPASSVTTSVYFNANQYISAGDILEYDRTQPWSVATDIQVASNAPGPGYNLPQGGAELIFGNTNGAPYRGYELWIDDSGHLRVRIMSDFLAGNYIDVTGNTDVADGKPHFIGASYDGSSKAAGVSLYVDGVREQTSVLSNNLTGSTAGNGPFIIGNQLNGWQDQFQLAGSMTDFYLSNTARDSSYFQPSAKASLIDAHTQLAYDFAGNNGGLQIADGSGHGNTGTLSTSALWVYGSNPIA